MPKDRGGITQRLATWLNQNGISTNNTILVGVSGGNDSMVLAESLVRCGHPIEVGHVNYQLRGAESDGDAKHVRAWCASRKVVLHEHTERPDELGEGVQSEARRIRYRWFANIQAQIALKTKAPVYIALAHHADDQAETVLLHLLRSSNPLAPSSMKSMNQSNGIIRPFLDEFRSELEHWASQWELHPREDSSNLKSDYLRNRIRHEVLPLLEELRPGTSRHLARTASRLQPLSDEMKRSIDQAQSRCTKVQLEAIELDLKCWRQEPLRAEVLYALARHFNVSSKAVPEINALTAQDVESGSKFASNTVVVIRAKTTLLWTPQIAKT